MQKFTKQAQKAIKSLAVRYNAFNNANRANDSQEVVVWGNLLLAVMDEIGFDTFDRRPIEALIESHRAQAMREAQKVLNGG